MFFVVALVVLFSPVKLRRRDNLRHNFPEPEYTRYLNRFLRSSRKPALFCVMIKDYGAVISTDIRTLAVQLCRIMDRPENVKKLFVADLRRIVGNLHNLGMAGLPGANVFVGRIF